MDLARGMVALLFATVALAGCLGDDDAPETPVVTEATPREGDLGAPVIPANVTPDPIALEPRARAVVAVIDTGINPYNTEFRDTSPEAYVHPSEYLPGYPEDVPALWLSFDHEEYVDAVLADCDVWQNVERGKMYWIPGTRIIGGITFDSADEIPCEDGQLPGAIIDRGGHGTMTASRAAGAEYSLCPTCKIVFIQGFAADNMIWAANQGWIDAQTNSWGDLPHSWLADRVGASAPIVPANSRAMVIDAASKHFVFVAGGNGLAGFFGVTGHPAYFDNVAGPQGIIMVGGHDNGYLAPWTMTMPHVVADANAHPGAEFDQIEGGTETSGGGTSGATPFVAGAFLQMIIEAREAVCDYGTGVRDGSFVWGGPDCEAPGEGPLSDGFLSYDEAKAVLYATADPRPKEEQPWDGPACGVVSGVCPGLYTTTPLRYADVPADVPLYYYVGYGQVGEATLATSISVVLGEQAVPARPQEDQIYGIDTDLRETLDG